MQHLYRNVLKAQGAWNVCLCLVPQPLVIKCSILECWCEPYPVYFNKGITNNQSDEPYTLLFFLGQACSLLASRNHCYYGDKVVILHFSRTPKLWLMSVNTQHIIRPSQRCLKLSSLIFFLRSRNLQACEMLLLMQQSKRSSFHRDISRRVWVNLQKTHLFLTAHLDSGAGLADIYGTNLVCQT